MEIKQNELLRYLGWRGQELDEFLRQRLENVAKHCLNLAKPRSVARRFSLDAEKNLLRGTDFYLRGDDVRAHLSGCREIYLFAATVGAEPEREVQKLFVEGNATEALLLDTAASCAIESYADDVCEDLERSARNNLTARFSCGYGDFPLEAQAHILRILSADTRIGLCANEHGLLTPQKSITAILGITAEPLSETKQSFREHKCERCSRTDCSFRKD